MLFYRRLKKIKAISFDLDDTLYNNRPIMQAIEQKMVQYFAEKFATLVPELLVNAKVIFDQQFWLPYRKEAIKKHQDLTHDVVRLRYEAYRLGFLAYNLSEDIAQKEAQLGLDYFIKLRSDFTVPSESHELLSKLSALFPLVSISNGNVNTKSLGINHYFTHIYHAGFQSDGDGEYLLKQKPEPDMFSLVCEKLNILPEHLLHVGDCGFADIHGALSAGCQTAWLPQYGVGKALQQTPHIALTQLDDLSQLITE